jgi:nitroreductase
MEYGEILRRRRMVREFDQRALEPAAVERILASGLRGPSAGFAQGFGFLVLTEDADRERFWPFVPNQVRHKPRLKNAPLVIIPIADQAAYLERREESMWPAPYWQIDTAMAAMLIQLTAIDEGLDAFFFWLMPDADTDFDGDDITAHLDRFRDEFGVPRTAHPIGAIAVGYRALDLPPQRPGITTERRPPDAVIHHGRWG